MLRWKTGRAVANLFIALLGKEPLFLFFYFFTVLFECRDASAVCVGSIRFSWQQRTKCVRIEGSRPETLMSSFSFSWVKRTKKLKQYKGIFIPQNWLIKKYDRTRRRLRRTHRKVATGRLGVIIARTPNRLFAFITWLFLSCSSSCSRCCLSLSLLLGTSIVGREGMYTETMFHWRSNLRHPRKNQPPCFFFFRCVCVPFSFLGPEEKNSWGS